MEFGGLLSEVFLLEKFLQNFSLLQRPPISQAFKLLREFLYFIEPIEKSYCWGYYEERAEIVLVLGEVTHQGNRLDCLSQSHFICQDSIDSLGVQIIKPS